MTDDERMLRELHETAEKAMNDYEADMERRLIKWSKKQFGGIVSPEHVNTCNLIKEMATDLLGVQLTLLRITRGNLKKVNETFGVDKLLSGDGTVGFEPYEGEVICDGCGIRLVGDYKYCSNCGMKQEGA